MKISTKEKAKTLGTSATTSTRIPSFRHHNQNRSSDRDVGLHQQLHEDLSEEILHMAKGLKENALQFREKLGKSAVQLEQAETNLEQNLANAKVRNKQAKVFYKRNWATSCKGYLFLFISLFVFAMIYMFIRVTSFAGYSSQTNKQEL